MWRYWLNGASSCRGDEEGPIATFSCLFREFTAPDRNLRLEKHIVERIVKGNATVPIRIYFGCQNLAQSHCKFIFDYRKFTFNRRKRLLTYFDIGCLDEFMSNKFTSGSYVSSAKLMN